MNLLTKEIIYFGESCVLACDQKCNKAWGLNKRPYAQLDQNNDDDIVWYADNELGEAPKNPGTYEGGHGKPLFVSSPEDMNKWCARECERSTIVNVGEMINLRDYSKRFYNIETSDPDQNR